jgi:transposase
MSVEFKIADRRTKYLIPESVDEWLPEDHLARFVVEIVDDLDIDRIKAAYKGCGIQAYDPKVLLALLFYGYATGVFSSRKIERATYDSVAFRYVSANLHPDHDTISVFRKRFLAELGSLFVQILRLASEMKILKLGTVSLDGTKIKANASKHSAYSWEYANKIEDALRKEVEELFRKAEEADNDPEPDGMDIPQELAFREKRIEAIRRAKAEIERRASERHEAELAEYEKKMSARKEKAESTGKKPRGRVPVPPSPGPEARDQVNLTDEESRIMPVSGGGFEQCYNAQAAVDTKSLLIVAAALSQNTNDKNELQPALEALNKLPDELGNVDKLLADAGYYSGENVKKCEETGVEPYISPRREPHYGCFFERFKEAESIESDDPAEQMAQKLRTLDGRALYARRKCTVEPVFGVIKAVMGFRQFMLRGIRSVRNEWELVCMAWNLKRLHKLKISVYNSG